MHKGHTTAADRLSVNLSIINMIMITLNPQTNINQDFKHYLIIILTLIRIEHISFYDIDNCWSTC